MKHTVGICGVNHWKKRWSSFHTDLCARCLQHTETAQHVWLCPAPSSLHQWQVSIDKLDETLASLGTAPAIQQAMIQGLQEWRHQLAPTTHLLSPGAAAQSTIGWQDFLEGRIASQWASEQQSYFTQIGSRRSGRKWAASVIVAVITVAWELWLQRNEVDLATNANWLLQQARLTAQEDLARGVGSLTGSSRTQWQLMRQRTTEQFQALSTNALRMWTHSMTVARTHTVTYLDGMRQTLANFLHGA